MNIYIQNKYAFVLFSFFILSCLILNILSIPFRQNSGALCKMSATVVEQFFTVSNLPSDVLSAMMLQKNKTSSSNSEDENEHFNINYDIAFGGAFVPANMLKNAIVFGTNILAGVCAFVNSVVDYPLKIPFWRCIFFILLFRILFNVLPRSISVNYYKNCIGKSAFYFTRRRLFYLWRQYV